MEVWPCTCTETSIIEQGERVEGVVARTEGARFTGDGGGSWWPPPALTPKLSDTYLTALSFKKGGK